MGFKSSNEPSKSSSEWHVQIKKEMKEILKKRKNPPHFSGLKVF